MPKPNKPTNNNGSNTNKTASSTKGQNVKSTVKYINGKPVLTAEELEVFKRQDYMLYLQEQQQLEKQYRKQATLARVNESDKKANPFFSLVLSGKHELLESYLTKHLITPEELLSYNATNIVTLPGLDLFPTLRLIETNTGNTLLHYAAMANVETCEVLLRLGITPFINARNKQGCSPIFLAAGQGKLDICKFFIEHGASLGVETKSSSSLLHTAVLSGNYDLVYYLLSLPQLQVNVDDDEFMTPFGLLIVKISEIKKSIGEMELLVKETILTVTQETTTFVIDENERIDALREELGINIEDDENDDDEKRAKKAEEIKKKKLVRKNGEVVDQEAVKYIDFAEQQRLITEEIETNEIIVSLRNGVAQGEKLLKSYKKIAALLMNPPVFKLTVPVSTREIDIEVDIGYDEEKPYEEQLDKVTHLQNKETTEKSNEDEQTTDSSLNSLIKKETKFIKRNVMTGGKEIFHTPERAKIVHFPPYISYWMLLVETQDLDLISLCIEFCDIDVNWKFSLGSKINNATALHYAIDLNNMDLVKLLVEKGGADLSAEMLLSISPLDGTIQQAAPIEKNIKGNGNVIPVKMQFDEGYENLITMVNEIQTKFAFVMHTTKGLYNDFIDVLKRDNINNNEEHTKKHITKAIEMLKILSPQQGFTPFIAALYNKQHDIAVYLLKYGYYRNLGQTYLKTHAITSKRALLSADLLDEMQPEDSQKQIQEYQKNLENTYTNHTTAVPLPKLASESFTITSFQDLLMFLFPYLSTPVSEILEPQMEAQREQYQEELSQVASPRATFQEKQRFQMLDNILHGYHSPMIPDALRISIQHGYNDITHDLLTLGVDINAPYFYAKVTMVKFNKELHKNLDFDYMVTVELADLGFTPLFSALKTQNTDVIKQLLSINADINLSLYTYLLARGIDMNQEYILPLSATCDNVEDPLYGKKVQITFYSPTPAVPPIIQAVQYHPDVIQMMVSHNPHILKQITSEGRNALHYTCELNKSIASTYILSNDVSVMFRRDKYGMTPLAFGIAHDNYEIVNLLLGMMKRHHILNCTYHPQRPVIINSYDKGLENLASFDEIVNYYNKLDLNDKVAPFYPQIRNKSTIKESNIDMDDIDFDTADSTTPQGHIKSFDIIRPYWCDEITDMKTLVFAPAGFDSATFESYQHYMLSIYQPTIYEAMPKDNIAEFTTFHPIYDDHSQYNPNTQQLQTQPLRWLGFDISCANILSFYYYMINNSKDFTDNCIAKLTPLIENIDGIYGNIIRSYRLAAVTGSMLSLRALNSIFFVQPQVAANIYNDTTKYTADDLKDLEDFFIPQINKAKHPKLLKKHALWVELVVPTEEQLATRIASAGGYQLLSNNIVVDPHGFIARNVTYEYAAKVYAQTTGQSIITTKRLCIPLRAYLATEILSSISKQGFSAMLMESLSKQALPLLHGLTGVTFIRAFHQYYTCNPLQRSKNGELNLDGVIHNRIPSLPFTPFMINDIQTVNVPMNATNHIVVSKSQKEECNADQSKTQLNVYKAPQYSPLHIAVANDQAPLIRLLIGLSTNPDDKDDDDNEEEKEGSNNTPSNVQDKDHKATLTTKKITGLDGFESTPFPPDHKDIRQNLTLIDDNITDDPIFGDIQLNMTTLQELVQMLNLEEQHEHLEKQMAFEEQQQQKQQLNQDMSSDNVTLVKPPVIESKKVLRLPPLLHVPQPTNPIFQLINRCAIQSLTIETPINGDESKIETKTIKTIIHPLHLCALNDLADVGELLIQYGAIIDIPDHDGNTPLHLAVRDCSRLFTEVLLTYNADVNAQNTNGDTPMHVAVHCGYIDVAKILLSEYKGSATIQNNDGKSVEQLISEYEQRQIDATNDSDGDKLISFEQLLVPNAYKKGDKLDANGNEIDIITDTTQMNLAEKRQYNQRQMVLLRKELDKLRQL